GERIEDSNVLRNKVAGTLPGNPIKLTVTRDGAQQELTAALDEFNVEAAAADPNNRTPDENGAQPQPGGKLGVTLQPVTPQIAAQLQLPADTKGLIVTEIDPSGAAAEQGIARGDVILEINRQTVTTADDVQNALNNAGNKPILILISRRGQTIYLTVRPQ
ncbi:MAG TPA: PDZ domain-containing protein, partial [Pyrinomonadaceae bacterium]